MTDVSCGASVAPRASGCYRHIPAIFALVNSSAPWKPPRSRREKESFWLRRDKSRGSLCGQRTYSPRRHGDTEKKLFMKVSTARRWREIPSFLKYLIAHPMT